MILFGLLNEALERFNVPFQPLKRFSKRFIEWLFAHYYTMGFCIDWYDSEPDDSGINWETDSGINEWHHRIETYLPTSMQQLTWQDPFGEEIWGWTQDQVDSHAKRRMLTLRENSSLSHKHNRAWWARQPDGTFILYYWCRDDADFRCDYIWLMKERQNDTTVL